jgi:hypothetical protein
VSFLGAAINGLSRSDSASVHVASASESEPW